MVLNLIVLARCFAIDPKDIKEGVTYRYVGFYGSLIKALFKLSPESNVFWYSVDNQSLRAINRNGCQKRKASMMSAIINAISETLKNKSYLAVIVAYPSVLPKIDGILEYVFCLFFLKLASLGRIKTVVDDFDCRVEALYDVSETKPSTALVAYYRILEKTTLKLASQIVVLSEFWKNYISRIYRVKASKIFVVTNGSLSRLIPYKLKKPGQPLVVLYSGSATKVKNVDKLVSTIEKMRAQGMAVELHVAGIKVIDVPEWVHIAHYDWPNFISNSLFHSDVCVIPYPPEKFTFFHSIPAKLADYMAAGKPIISTNLKDVGDIIRSSNCGLVAKDWEEFEIDLERLYEDKALAEKLGYNGRVAAEESFNYELLAEMFLENLIKQFKTNQKSRNNADLRSAQRALNSHILLRREG